MAPQPLHMHGFDHITKIGEGVSIPFCLQPMSNVWHKITYVFYV